MIGHLRPSTPPLELDVGAVTVILPVPLALGQITASTTLLAMLTPTMVREPHFIRGNAEC